VSETVHVAGAKDETPAQLKRILTQFVLMVAGFARSFSSNRVIFAKKMKQVGGLEFRRAVGLALLIDQQGKRDSRFFQLRLLCLCICRFISAFLVLGCRFECARVYNPAPP
jgi:hypothetical protein